MKAVIDFLTGADIDRDFARKKSLLDQIKTDAAKKDATITSLQETNRRLVEAMFPEPVEKNGIRVSSDAILNLEGAYEDLKRYGADAVSLRTIERVLKQLEAARAILSELEQDKSDEDI